jgi:hypothetical protein
VFIIVASRRKKKVGNDLNKEDPRCTWSQEYEVKENSVGEKNLSKKLERSPLGQTVQT